MEKAFVYGVSVENENFTDRIKETKRLKLNFTNGLNTILISPRRMGKTSLVKKVIDTLDNPEIKVVYMDAYDCRSEYDFYNKFAASVIKQTSSKVDQWLENAKEFLVRVSPKISFSPDPTMDYSVSFGITPETHSPEEILSLPELIGAKKNMHIVVCIDEFQQIGEFPDSLDVQKRLRSVWQHQRYASYCLFGSKKHLMTKLFQNKRMPFYQFGEMMYLDKISTEDWVSYIQSRFKSRNKEISEDWCLEICRITDNYSSYVQQLAWNVLAETDKSVGEEEFKAAKEAMLAQCDALFVQQIQGLTTYQMNLLRAICNGVNNEFMSKKVMDTYNLGTKSNFSRIKNALIEKELIEERKDGLYLSDPIFKIWFNSNYND